MEREKSLAKISWTFPEEWSSGNFWIIWDFFLNFGKEIAKHSSAEEFRHDEINAVGNQEISATEEILREENQEPVENRPL